MSTAMRQGRGMSAPDGMIAAISRVNGDQLGDAELGRLRHDRSRVVLFVGVLTWDMGSFRTGAGQGERLIAYGLVALVRLTGNRSRRRWRGWQRPT